MQEKEQKQKVVYDSCGPSGNIYCIMGATMKVLEKQNRKDEIRQVYARVTSSDSYEAALDVIGEYVDLVDSNATDMEM